MKTNTKKLNFRDERVDGVTLIIKSGDIFTVEVGGCVSSTIKFTARNKYTKEEFFPHTIVNSREAWEWLKSVNEIPDRKVEIYNVREGTTVDFEDSQAYKYRWG